jgi:ubiquinone/menaquinone biosynthesis C-methylase UbiE
MTSERPESRQTAGFVDQSARFVRTHLVDYPGAPAWILESEVLRGAGVSNVLDVGCGPGNFLAASVAEFGAARGVGVEPSSDAVALLAEKFADDPRLEFATGQAHALPFETDSFDVVVCWSVLHWVGRNEYLQSLGELIRVTRRFLVVMDFVAGRDYRVPYSHDDRFFTYKMDFVPAVLASGIMQCHDDRRWWELTDAGEPIPVSQDDLRAFDGNPISYAVRRGCIFEKDYDALPVRVASDFEAATVQE